MAQVHALLDRQRGDWLHVTTGKSGDLVYRLSDGRAYAKLAGPGRSPALADERDRLIWLAAHGLAPASS